MVLISQKRFPKEMTEAGGLCSSGPRVGRPTDLSAKWQREAALVVDIAGMTSTLKSLVQGSYWIVYEKAQRLYIHSSKLTWK